jgi:hypothetical protein
MPAPIDQKISRDRLPSYRKRRYKRAPKRAKRDDDDNQNRCQPSRLSGRPVHSSQQDRPTQTLRTDAASPPHLSAPNLNGANAKPCLRSLIEQTLLCDYLANLGSRDRFGCSHSKDFQFGTQSQVFTPPMTVWDDSDTTVSSSAPWMSTTSSLRTTRDSSPERSVGLYEQLHARPFSLVIDGFRLTGNERDLLHDLLDSTPVGDHPPSAGPGSKQSHSGSGTQLRDIYNGDQGSKRTIYSHCPTWAEEMTGFQRDPVDIPIISADPDREDTTAGSFPSFEGDEHEIKDDRIAAESCDLSMDDFFEFESVASTPSSRSR